MKSMRIASIVAAALICSLATAAHAAYLSAPSYDSGGTAEGVQGGGGMYMLSVSFTAVRDAGGAVIGGSLSMAPQAKPIYLAVRPEGSFDPLAAWKVLNGTGYSRRLGWNAGTGLADIPTGDSIWIEQLSASAGLKCYYAQNANPAGSSNPITQTYTYYGGMFGTAGSPTTWHWDQKMDHNAYTLDLTDVQWAPGQTVSASYRLYIGDAQGNEIRNDQQQPIFGSTTEVWTWTVPEPTTLATLTIGLTILTRRRHAAD